MSLFFSLPVLVGGAVHVSEAVQSGGDGGDVLGTAVTECAAAGPPVLAVGDIDTIGGAAQSLGGGGGGGVLEAAVTTCVAAGPPVLVMGGIGTIGGVAQSLGEG